MSQNQSEIDWGAWGVELNWVEPQRLEYRLVKHRQAPSETPRMQAYRRAVALGEEEKHDQALQLYEEVLWGLSSEEVLLGQMACWGRSSALQQLERFEEAWVGLTTLLAPGRSWLAPLVVFLNWLQTAIPLAAQVGHRLEAGALLHLWHEFSVRFPQLGLEQRFGELMVQAFDALAEEDLDEAVDWLDTLRLKWESPERLLPAVRDVLVEGWADLFEFEDALEEAEEVVAWAFRLGDDELLAEWSERVDDLRDQSVDPYYLARRDDRQGLERLGKVNQLGSKSGRNALMGAVVSNNPELVVWLLRRGADPNLIARDGWNPILLAADHNLPEMISLLVEWRANLQATNDLDQNCLHVAAWQDYQEAARLVIELGIEVDYCDNRGNTPLHLAACEEIPEMLELLAGVMPVDVRNDCNECTPLMLAAECNRLENLKVLLRLGADPQLRDVEDKCALDYAREFEATEAVHFLEGLSNR